MAVGELAFVKYLQTDIRVLPTVWVVGMTHYSSSKIYYTLASASTVLPGSSNQHFSDYCSLVNSKELATVSICPGQRQGCMLCAHLLCKSCSSFWSTLSREGRSQSLPRTTHPPLDSTQKTVPCRPKGTRVPQRGERFNPLGFRVSSEKPAWKKCLFRNLVLWGHLRGP